MFWRVDGDVDARGRSSRTGVVVAGPGSALTIPGIVTSEIVRAIAATAKVTRIEVDVAPDFTAGLHRAPSLASAHDENKVANIVRHRAPGNERLRIQAFRDWMSPENGTAIAYAWPGIDNGWIKQFLSVAKSRSMFTIVLCASLPKANAARPIDLADVLSQADRVYVGDIPDALDLASAFGPQGPMVQAHRALSLDGPIDRLPDRQITTFLPKDNAAALSTVLAAFDAIPEAWIKDYQLRVVMRYAGKAIPDLVAGSYHADHVRLIGEDISSSDLQNLCTTSSALSVANPALDSRAFSSAVDSGVATVVMATAGVPEVGQGYVGGLIADLGRPASVHVALNHALRLEELRFPTPDAWGSLARTLEEAVDQEAPKLRTPDAWGSLARTLEEAVDQEAPKLRSGELANRA